MAQLGSDYGDSFFDNGWGISIIIGLITSLLAVVLVFTVEVPTVKKIETLTASLNGREPSPEEGQQLKNSTNRVILIGRFGTVLLMIALASMAAARFV